MALETTMARLRTIIIEQTGQDGDWVVPALKMADMGDNLDRVEVIMAIEESFSIEIRDEDFSPDTTVEQLAALAERRSRGDGEIGF